MFIRFLTTKLLAGWKEGKLHLTRWGKGKAHNCPEQNACREGQPLQGWVQLFSTSGKLLTFDPQRWPAESRWWMSRACHSQCMLRALALLAFGSVGIRMGPGEQDMEQLMMYQIVVPTAGHSRCQESLAHHMLRNPGEKSLITASFSFCYQKSFSDFYSLLWLFKSLLNLLQYCFCFMFLFLWPRGMWDLSSLTRDRTHSPLIGRQNLNHWTTREVPT